MSGPRDSPRAWPVLLTVNLVLLPWLFYGLQSDDTDTFYHLAAGRYMATHGGVLDREVASFTIAGRPWTNYSWLFQTVLYRAERLAGVPGVLAVRSFFLALIVNLLFLLVWRRSRGDPLVTVTLVLLGIGLIGSRGLQVRPHLASYAALAALLFLIDRPIDRAGRAALAAFGICALWANLHGIGYPVGMAAAAVFALAAFVPHGRRVGAALAAPEPRRRLALVAACAIGFLANPFGWRLLSAPLVATDPEAMSQIGEMGRLPLAAFAALGANLELRSTALVNLVVLGGLALVPTWLAASAASALGSFVLGVALLLFRGRRVVPELAIFALPAIAGALAIRFAQGRGRGLRRGLQVLAVYLVVAAAVTTWRDAQSGLFEPLSDRLPHGPVALLQRLGFEGHVFADVTQSGFVSWRLPGARTFMDMRMPEPFSTQEVWLYRAAGQTVSLDSINRRYPIDAVLVRLDSPLARRLRAHPEDNFGIAYADDRWALFLPEPVLASRPDLRLSFVSALETIADGGAPEPAVDPQALAREVDRLLEIGPGNHLAWRTWLWLRTQGGHAVEAANQAHALARRYPRLPVYPFAEGLAWSAAGQAEPAAAAFQAALHVDPDYEPSYPALSRTLAGLGRAGRALAVLEEFHERRRYRLDVADTALLASLRRSQGRLQGAADAYERALWITPETDVRRKDLERGLEEVCRQLGRQARKRSACDPREP